MKSTALLLAVATALLPSALAHAPPNQPQQQHPNKRADDDDDDDQDPLARHPLPTDAESYLARLTPSVTLTDGAARTSLASALYAVESSWYANPAELTAESAVFTAAARAEESESLVASLGVSGIDWFDVATQAWYEAEVPTGVREDVDGFLTEWQSAVAGIYEDVEGENGAGRGASAAGLLGVLVAGVVGLAVVL